MCAENRQVPYTWLEKLRYVIYSTFFAVYVFTASVLLIFVIVLLKPIIYRSHVWYMRIIFETLQFIVGVRIEVKDAHKMKNAPKAVIVMNHQTIWDLYIVCTTYYHYGEVHTVSRKEVFYLWPLGLSMWLSGSLFVDLKAPQGALNGLISDSRKAFSNSKKAKVIMFPEGTRNKNNTSFLNFKQGAFKLAAACDVPVVPIVVPPQTFLRKFNRSTVTLQCLDPVNISADKDLDVQINDIRDSMLEVYKKQIDELKIKGEII